MGIDCNGELSAPNPVRAVDPVRNVELGRAASRFEMVTTAFRHGGSRAVVLLAIVMSGSGAGAQSMAATDAATTGPALVVRVANEARLPGDLLLAARQRASEIFEGAGVLLRWRDADAEELRPAAGAEPEAFVILASSRLTGVICAANRLSPHVMGAAIVRRGQLAYVFTDRIDLLSARKHLMPFSVLGEVIAHELGHLLLPDLAHAKGGVMRATLDVRFHAPAQFTEDEAAALRARLSVR
jgi:hypothetical protein